MRFSVIIPVFNQPVYTKVCLDSVLRNTPAGLAEVIVVDNGSLEPCRDVLASYGDAIRVVRLDKNEGVAVGCNRGIEASTGEVLVLMHNDCVVPRGWGDGLLSSAAALDGGGFGVLTPMTNYSDERTYVYSDSLMDRFVGLKPDNKSRPTEDEVLRVVEATYGPLGGLDRCAANASRASSVARADETSSFCMVVRRDVLDRVGAFGESFRLRGYEDKDLLARIEAAGLAAGRAPFFLHHFGNVTSDGPGFNCHDMKSANKLTYEALLKAYAVARRPDGGWSAIVFPDDEQWMTTRLLRSVARLSDQPDAIVEVPRPGIFPESAALAWALPRVETPLVALMDSDLVLDRDAIDRMRQYMRPSVGCVAALMRDPCIGPDGYFRLWRTDVLRRINEGADLGVVAQDVGYYEACEAMGLKFLRVPDVVGDHAIRFEPWNVFKIFFRKGVKQRSLGRIGTRTQLWGVEGAMRVGTPWSHVALLGFHQGVQADYGEDPHAPAFDEFAYAAYSRVRVFCEALVAECVRPDRGAKAPTIKVALASSTFVTGGCEKTMLNMALFVDKSRFEPVIMFSEGRSPLFGERAERSGVRLVEVGSDSARAWRAALAEEQPDMVVTFLKCGAIDAASSMGIPMIERPPGWFGHSGVDKARFERVACEYDCFRRELLEAGLGATASKTDLVYNCVDPAEFGPVPMSDAKRVTGVRDNAFVICMPTRLAPKKNASLMVEALGIVVASGVDAELHVVGRASRREEAAEKEKAEDKARQLGLAGRLFFHGERPLVDYLGSADVVALSSDEEGASNVVLEAMAMGRPIASTDVGGIRETTCGLASLAPPGSADKLARAILDLRGRGSVDYPHFWQRHSTAEFARRWAALFEEVYLKSHDSLPYPARPDDRFRVALLMNTLEIGGTESFARTLDELMDRDRFELFVYAWRGGAIEHLFRGRVRIAGGPFEATDERFAKWLCQDGIDVAVAVSYTRCASLFAASRPCRVVERADGAWFRAFATSGVPDVVVFQSPRLAEEMAVDFPSHRHVMIRNGRNLTAYARRQRAEARHSLGVDDHTLVLASVGRLHHTKKFPMLPAVGKALMQKGIKFRMFVMGPEWGDRDHILAGASAAGIGKRLEILKADPLGVPALLSAADIFLHPSSREGLSGALIEAAAAGLPIIASDVGATRDVVGEDNGFVVPTGDADAFAAAVVRLGGDAKLRGTMGAASLEKSKLFCAKKMVSEYESLLAEEAATARRSRDALATIVIPVHDRHRFLREAMLSVMGQTDPDWRLIVALDTMEPSAEVLGVLGEFGDERVSVVRSPHKNQCSAMNSAARVVATRLMLRLDSDDELAPGAVAAIRAADQEGDYFYCGMSFIDESGQPAPLNGASAVMPAPFSPEELEERYVANRALGWRTSKFLSVGGYAEDIPCGEDWLLALAMMLDHAKFVPINEVLYRRRTHGEGSITSRLTANEKDFYMDAVRDRYEKLKGTT